MRSFLNTVRPAWWERVDLTTVRSKVYVRLNPPSPLVSATDNTHLWLATKMCSENVDKSNFPDQQCVRGSVRLKWQCACEEPWSYQGSAVSSSIDGGGGGICGGGGGTLCGGICSTAGLRTQSSTIAHRMTSTMTQHMAAANPLQGNVRELHSRTM